MLEHFYRVIEIKNVAFSIFYKMEHFLELKVFFAVALLFLFDIDNLPKIYALFALIAFDLITGVLNAHKRGEVITSRLIYRTPIKLAVYAMLISTAALLEKSIGHDVGADEMMIIFLGATEFISIVENFGKLGFRTPNKLLNTVKDLQGKQ